MLSCGWVQHVDMGNSCEFEGQFSPTFQKTKLTPEEAGILKNL